MVTIEYVVRNKGAIKFITHGHANYVDEGPDVLCAFMSGMSQMLINSITSFTESEVLKHVDEKEGYMRVELDECNVNSETVFMMNAFIMMCVELTEQYPKNVCAIKRRNEDYEETRRRYEMATN